MEKDIKIADLVIIENHGQNLPENIIVGGRVIMLTDTLVLVQRSNGAILSYKRELVRKLRPEDVKEGTELY